MKHIQLQDHLKSMLYLHYNLLTKQRGGYAFLEKKADLVDQLSWTTSADSLL